MTQKPQLTVEAVLASIFCPLFLITGAIAVATRDLLWIAVSVCFGIAAFGYISIILIKQRTNPA